MWWTGHRVHHPELLYLLYGKICGAEAFAQPILRLLDNGYDYYECIRILENDTNEMQAYLQNKQESYPDFRSSRTGYTYADLCDIYTDFKKYTIPELYAYVLNGPQVRDGTVLQEYLANCIETAKQTEQITTDSGTVCGD